MRKKTARKKSKEESPIPINIEECAKKFFKGLNKEQEVFHKKTHETNGVFYRKSETAFVRMLKSLREERDILKKALQESNDILQNVDSTLCNVLLAIRQNEYLQAWYPEYAPKKKNDVDLILERLINKDSVKTDPS